jgi:hypothetical protein
MSLGFGIRDPVSGKNLIRIPDPGVKKATDPGSGSATLLPMQKYKKYKKYKKGIDAVIKISTYWYRTAAHMQPLPYIYKAAMQSTATDPTDHKASHYYCNAPLLSPLLICRKQNRKRRYRKWHHFRSGI